MKIRGRDEDVTNFLDLFVYAAGVWKTPAHFHRWAGISLLAACLEDRITLKIFDHAPLHPNLWIFLIGGSGVGKDHAIGHALSYLNLDPEDENADNLYVWDGKVTIPSLYDLMQARQKETLRDSVPIYLVSSDVGEQLPLGPEAKDFTSRALGLYGGRDRMLRESTRTSGQKFVKKPLLNWVAGCTPEWFPNAIDPEVFASGFAGRAFFVWGEPENRYEHMLKVMYPNDLAMVKAEIRKRVNLYQRVEGTMEMTKRARIVIDDWLLQRAQDKARAHLTNLEKEVRGRQPTAMLKLAVVFSLADWWGTEPLRLKHEHAVMAISVVESLTDGLQQVGNYVYRNEDTKIIDMMRDKLREARTIDHSRFLRHACSRGVKNVAHFDALIETLKQQGVCTIERTKPKTGRPGKLYLWKTRQMRFAVKEETREEQDENARVLLENSSAGESSGESSSEP